MGWLKRDFWPLASESGSPARSQPAKARACPRKRQRRAFPFPRLFGASFFALKFRFGAGAGPSLAALRVRYSARSRRSANGRAPPFGDIPLR
jgi:hypothetical protein